MSAYLLGAGSGGHVLGVLFGSLQNEGEAGVISKKSRG